MAIRHLLGARDGFTLRLHLLEHPQRHRHDSSFSANHQISGPEAWTAALLAMAVFEVCGRTLDDGAALEGQGGLASQPQPRP